MQRYKNTVHTRSLLQSEADCSICNFCLSSPRGEIQWWDFIYPLTAGILPPPLSSKPWSSLKKMRLTCWIYPRDDNRFSLQEAVQSTLRQCFIARWLRSACWRHRVSLHVRHDHSGSPNLSSADHCASDGGEEVARAVAGEMCLLWRLGSARISRWWIFHVAPVALLMHRVRKGCKTWMTWAGSQQGLRHAIQSRTKP